MVNSEIRDQIHKLIDKASDTQLDAVLQVLESSSVENKYTKEDFDSFYERITMFETDGSKGYSVEESHAMIRNKQK
ncbi:hypothetical protein FRZ67_06105 [Panacibacter ginsenosidivorans]|uniref:Addiction module protein n=1 Tax=Panacibacter ginsenosidivorans TaxID=1813871 RepID=A0A5B8V964_9BACT|nr:hypothetical protein [Panacibacter ginsenosidivorans]QEC66888.1 hypothetical protein FRZ67_06105 [Panacibacter ginsenosidivorans]